MLLCIVYVVKREKTQVTFWQTSSEGGGGMASYGLGLVCFFSFHASWHCTWPCFTCTCSLSPLPRLCLSCRLRQFTHFYAILRSPVRNLTCLVMPVVCCTFVYVHNLTHLYVTLHALRCMYLNFSHLSIKQQKYNQSRNGNHFGNLETHWLNFGGQPR